MSDGSWACLNCGSAMRSDQLTCTICGKKYKLDASFTHMEYAEPPLEKWAEELKVERSFSAESMAEVLEESRKRMKKTKRSGKKRFGIF